MADPSSAEFRIRFSRARGLAALFESPANIADRMRRHARLGLVARARDAVQPGHAPLRNTARSRISGSFRLTLVSRSRSMHRCKRIFSSSSKAARSCRSTSRRHSPPSNTGLFRSRISRLNCGDPSSLRGAFERSNCVWRHERPTRNGSDFARCYWIQQSTGGVRSKRTWKGFKPRTHTQCCAHFHTWKKPSSPSEKLEEWLHLKLDPDGAREKAATDCSSRSRVRQSRHPRRGESQCRSQK